MPFTNCRTSTYRPNSAKINRKINSFMIEVRRPKSNHKNILTNSGQRNSKNHQSCFLCLYLLLRLAAPEIKGCPATRTGRTDLDTFELIGAKSDSAATLRIRDGPATGDSGMVGEDESGKCSKYWSSS